MASNAPDNRSIWREPQVVAAIMIALGGLLAVAIGASFTSGFGLFENDPQNSTPTPTTMPEPTNTPTALPPDTVHPVTSLGGDLPKLTSDTSISFSITSNEIGSTFECQLDYEGWKSCPSKKEYDELRDAQHIFEARAVDAAGNTDASPAFHWWIVDTLGPEIAIIFVSTERIRANRGGRPENRSAYYQ